MKVKNKTEYRMVDLKKIFTQVIRRIEKVEGKLPDQRKYLLVNVVHTQGRGYSGLAEIDGYYMKIRLPKSKNVEINNRKVAWLFEHELMHILGYRHKQMGGSKYPKNYEEWAWADEMEIRLQEEKVVEEEPKENIQVRRYEHVLVMLEQRELKLDETKRAVKRIEKQIVGWNRKKLYYEMAFARKETCRIQQG